MGAAPVFRSESCQSSKPDALNNLEDGYREEEWRKFELTNQSKPHTRMERKLLVSNHKYVPPPHANKKKFY